MVNTLYLPELREMLAEDNAAEMREFCVALHPARTAEFMEGLTATEAWAILRHAEVPTRAEVLGYFDREKQVEIIEQSPRAEIAELIAALPSDDRVDILKEADPEVVEELLPGYAVIHTDADYSLCLTGDIYSRRPPVETKGWSKVIEIGFAASGTSIDFVDPLLSDTPGISLPVRASGHYRIRIHYQVLRLKGDDWAAQQLHFMVFPGAGDKVNVLK